MERFNVGSITTKELETLWDILETTLLSDNEQIAAATFKLLISYVQLDRLHQKSMLAQKNGTAITQAKENSLEKLWGSVLMAYRCGQMNACRKSFIRAVEIHCRFAELAGYPRILIPSTSPSS